MGPARFTFLNYLQPGADDLPRPPERPEDAMCCHRGCCPCIFDYYHDALARWEAAVRERGCDPAEILGRKG